MNDCVVALKPVERDLLLLVAALRSRSAMPAAVLFWPRTIGCDVAPLKVSVYESPLVS